VRTTTKANHVSCWRCTGSARRKRSNGANAAAPRLGHPDHQGTLAHDLGGGVNQRLDLNKVGEGDALNGRRGGLEGAVGDDHAP
jgi:hypothetical protein